MNFLSLRKESDAKNPVKLKLAALQLFFKQNQLFPGKPVKISERRSKRKVIFGKSLRKESGAKNPVKLKLAAQIGSIDRGGGVGKNVTVFVTPRGNEFVGAASILHYF